MDPEQLKQVRKAADEAHRGEQPVDFTLLVEAAASAGPVHWRDAAELASQPKHGAASRSMHLLEFVAELARSLRPASVLDAHVEAPTILAAAQDGSGSARSGGLVRDERIYAAAQHIAPADWRVGDPFAMLRDLPPEHFDLVIAEPPLGLVAKAASEPDDPAGRIDYADLVVWRAAPLVANGGFLLFHTVDNFWWLADRRERWTDFARRSLFPQAVVSVAKGRVPYTGIDTSIVLFGRAPAAQLFVARLEPDTSVATLVQNLVARRSDRDPYFGTLVPPDAYQGWRGAILARELASMFGSTTLRSLGEIARIRSVRLRSDELYEPTANTVFIPTLGMGDVRTIPPGPGKARERGFLEVQLDPELARAEYVAGVLSSAVGRRLRESVAIGATILRLAAVRPERYDCRCRR